LDQARPIHREITQGAVVGPPPSWVDVAKYSIPEPPNPHFVVGGVCALLDDSQIDLCGPERAWFYRRADLVTAPAGAERVAQFSVAFDPAFEHIDVHSITVIRQGERFEHAGSGFFEVLRRERNMERLQFDGRLTIHMTLPDVRQGDVVETAYTLYGMRRSLGGRQSLFVPLEWSVGILEVRLRHRWPKHRAIAERSYNNAPQGTQTEADGVIDRRWRTVERPGFRYEPLAPPWTLQSAELQISEWRDWAEVASVFTPLYEDAASLPAEVEQEVARIAASETTPAGRAAAILRFVQGSVRYLAISMGEGGYTPRPLGEICASRYGDCKDKSKLYTLMAHRLGVDACPALVNTRDGYALIDWLPSGQLFDHCIVRVAIDGKIYWLDPTLHPQPSPIETLSQCYFGWALPLCAGVANLEKMAEPPVQHLSETYEEVALGNSPTVPVQYKWKHTFRGTGAESIRDQLARDGPVGVFKSYAEDIRRVWHKAEVIKQEIVEDDVVNNAITVVEDYEIADAWSHVEGDKYEFLTLDLVLNRTLAKLDAGERLRPVYLGMPGRRSRRVDIRHTVDTSGGGWDRRFEGSTIRSRNEMRLIDRRWIVLEQDLAVQALTLPAAEADIYRKVQADLSNSEVVIAETVERGKFVGSRGRPQTVGWWTTTRWILVVLWLIWIVSRIAASQ